MEKRSVTFSAAVFGVTALAAVVLAAPALAQAVAAPVTEGGPVVIRWGAAVEWLIAGALAAMGGSVGIAAWLLRKVPSQFRWLLTAARVDQLLGRAIEDGINRTKGAVRGQSYTLDTGLAIANQALQYAVEAAPSLAKELGVLNLWKKLLARIDFAADVAVPPDASPNLAGVQAFRALVK